MLYAITWKIPHSTRTEALERFRQSAGVPPHGIELVARYHFADGSGGITIGECSDVKALYRWSFEWSDLLILDTRPILTDSQVRKALDWDA